MQPTIVRDSKNRSRRAEANIHQNFDRVRDRLRITLKTLSLKIKQKYHVNPIKSIKSGIFPQTFCQDQ